MALRQPSLPKQTQSLKVIYYQKLCLNLINFWLTSVSLGLGTQWRLDALYLNECQKGTRGQRASNCWYYVTSFF